jgi:hypothetical protein
MRSFIFGIALVYGVLLAAACIEQPDELQSSARFAETLALNLLAVPVLAAWLAAECLNSGKRARRVLERLPECLTLGIIAGAIGAAWSVLALVLLDTALPDALLTGAGATAGAVIVVALLPRVKAGTCLRCGYDLSGATAASGGKCTECGWNSMECAQA